MVAFLASPLAAVTNGATVKVEGELVPTIARSGVSRSVFL